MTDICKCGHPFESHTSHDFGQSISCEDCECNEFIEAQK